MTRYRFEYCALRYFHDVWTGEFLNIGVVLFCPDQAFLGSRISCGIQRARFTFGDVNIELFQGFTKDLVHLLEQERTNLRGIPALSKEDGLSRIITGVLPHDDSSFQWGPILGGMTDSPEAEVDSLYDRYVGRYEKESYGAALPLDLRSPKC